jgi:NitT/TauT family transport system permease protein
MSTERLAAAKAVEALIVLLSLAILFGFWAAAAAIAQSRVLPPPDAVLAFLWQEAVSGELWLHLGMTLVRVAAAFWSP